MTLLSHACILCKDVSFCTFLKHGKLLEFHCLRILKMFSRSCSIRIVSQDERCSPVSNSEQSSRTYQKIESPSLLKVTIQQKSNLTRRIVFSSSFPTEGQFRKMKSSNKSGKQKVLTVSEDELQATKAALKAKSDELHQLRVRFDHYRREAEADRRKINRKVIELSRQQFTDSEMCLVGNVTVHHMIDELLDEIKCLKKEIHETKAENCSSDTRLVRQGNTLGPNANKKMGLKLVPGIQSRTMSEEEAIIAKEFEKMRQACHVPRNGPTLLGKTIYSFSKALSTFQTSFVLDFSNLLDETLTNPKNHCREGQPFPAKPTSIKGLTREAFGFESTFKVTNLSHVISTQLHVKDEMTYFFSTTFIEGMVVYQVGSSPIQLSVAFSILADGRHSFAMAFAPIEIKADENLLSELWKLPPDEKLRQDKKMFGPDHQHENVGDLLVIKSGNLMARATLSFGWVCAIMRLEIGRVEEQEVLALDYEDAALLPKSGHGTRNSEATTSVVAICKELAGHVACVIETNNCLNFQLEDPVLLMSDGSLQGKFPSVISAFSTEVFVASSSRSMWHMIRLIVVWRLDVWLSHRIGNTDIRIGIGFKNHLRNPTFAIRFIPSNCDLDKCHVESFMSSTDNEWKTRSDRKFLHLGGEAEQVIQVRNIRLRATMTLVHSVNVLQLAIATV